MVTAHPDRQTEPAPYIEDQRPPWQRARELLADGYDWQQIKSCIQADCRARIAFAEMLDDEDMAWLADADSRGVIAEIEGAPTHCEEEVAAILDELDQRDGLPPFGSEADAL